MKTFLYSLALLVALAPIATHAQKRPAAASKKSSFHVWNEAFPTQTLARLGILMDTVQEGLRPRERKPLLEALRYANQEVSYVVASTLSDADKAAKIKALQQGVVAQLKKTLPSKDFDALVSKADKLTKNDLLSKLKGPAPKNRLSEFDAVFLKTDALGGNLLIAELAL